MFPDFQIKNYYNKIIFCDKEITINNRRQIFLFLIEHNLLNKINIFINHTQQNPYL